MENVGGRYIEASYARTNFQSLFVDIHEKNPDIVNMLDAYEQRGNINNYYLLLEIGRDPPINGEEYFLY